MEKIWKIESKYGKKNHAWLREVVINRVNDLNKEPNVKMAWKFIKNVKNSSQADYSNHWDSNKNSVYLNFLK